MTETSDELKVDDEYELYSKSGETLGVARYVGEIPLRDAVKNEGTLTRLVRSMTEGERKKRREVVLRRALDGTLFTAKFILTSGRTVFGFECYW